MKPINGNDDLFRALCLAVRFIMDPEYTKKFEQYGSMASLGRPTVGVIRTNFGEQPSRTVSLQRGRSSSIVGVRRSFNGTMKA